MISVCATDLPPPTLAEVRQLVAAEEGSTVIHAMACGAEVQLMSLVPRPAEDFDLRDPGDSDGDGEAS